MDIALTVIGCIASAFFSWFFSRRYYLKALVSQGAEAAEQIGRLTALLEQGKAAGEMSRVLLRQRRIEACAAEHRHAGTSVGLIDTYDDLSSAQKADLLDTVTMRVKGRMPKVNKYRS